MPTPITEEEKVMPTSQDDAAYAAYRQTLPDNLRNTRDADFEEGGEYRSRRYWELNGKPKDFNEGLSRNMFTKENDGLYHSTSVAYNPEKDEYEFMKSPNHPTLKKELYWYYGDKDGAPEFRKNYTIDKSGKYYKYVRKPPMQSAPQGQPEGGTGTTNVGSTPANVATQTGEKTGSSTSTTTSTTTVSPYDKWKNIDGLDDLINRIQKEVDGYKPETPEEREKREKREKRTAFLARLADAIGNMHTTYSYARGVKPMDLPNMSARAQQLYERAKAQRDRDRDRNINLAVQLAKLKSDKNRWGFEIEKQEQHDKRADQQAAAQAEQQKQRFDWEKEKAENELTQRAKEQEEGAKLKNRGYDIEEKRLAEQKRANRAEEGIKREAQRRAHQNNPDYTDFTLGDGHGTIRVPKTAINSHNFAAIYNSLPSYYRNLKGTPIYSTDAHGKKVITGYSNPSPEQMEIAVGAFLGDKNANTNDKAITREALMQLGKKIEGTAKYSSFSIH